ncbi:MAG: hypothetical protein WKF77_24835 [Planctomycetaceae bacterium]
MWKLLTEISLTLSMFGMVDNTPPKPSVSVECCGRLRHGVVAIGGETTGTTITFNRTVWELQMHDEAAREFAQEHNQEPVIVTGTLRKTSGTEVKDRWIIDVWTLSERDATTDKEGTRLTIQGTLRATKPPTSDSREITIDADGEIWPIDVSSNPRLQVKAESLVDQPVLLTGSLERVMEVESGSPIIIRVKTVKRSADLPIQGQKSSR